MIPLRDINPTATRPVVTYVVIGLNVAVFLYQVSLPEPLLQRLLLRFGFVPYYLTAEPHFGSLSTPFTSMFLHGDWLHLIGNLWFLHIFGDNVEDVLGRMRFVAFYLLCGLAAAFGQLAIDPASSVPMIGASGAIAGVLGAYIRLFPGARVVTLIPIFFLFFWRELPAVLFIFVWFLLQLLSGIGSLGVPGGGGGVAFFAHIGGFLAGLWLVRVFAPPPRLPRRRAA